MKKKLLSAALAAVIGITALAAPAHAGMNEEFEIDPPPPYCAPGTSQETASATGCIIMHISEAFVVTASLRGPG